MIRSRRFRPTTGAALAAALALALLSGCVLFPTGAYWPNHDRSAHGRTLRAPDGPPPPIPVRVDDATRARLLANASRRWEDESLAESARAMDPAHGRWVWGDVVRTVTGLYVEPVTERDLAVAGLLSLRAALETEAFRARFPEAALDATRAAFAEAIDVLVLKAGAADGFGSPGAGTWLEVALEKNRAMLGLPDGAVVAEVLFGAMDSLDPYTKFLTTEMHEKHRRRAEGAYVGVGITVEVREGRLFIADVFEDGPAAEARLAAGDEIVAVDGAPVAGATPAETIARIRGEEGTAVVLSVRAGGEGAPDDLRLVRERLSVPPVRGIRMLDLKPPVGYVKLAAFGGATARTLRKALARLGEEGAEGIILDLRGNPGGELLAAVDAAGALLEDGRVLRTHGRAPGATWTYNVPFLASPAWRGPLVCLVDEGTASAAEALAGALRARGRATLVGRRTYGKGAAQVDWPVGFGAGIVVLTVARVYDPDGTLLEGDGLVPDVVVPSPSPPPARLEDDPDVRAAARLATHESTP